MTWEPEVEEMEFRKRLAEQMGGPEGVSRQRRQGKLTVRERIALLADPGSFREWNALTGGSIYKDDQLIEFTPKPSVQGICKVGGRKVIFHAGDFTVRGGSGGHLMQGLGSEPDVHDRALAWRLPFIRLLDAAGGSVRSFEEIGRTYLPDGNIWCSVEVQLLSQVPVVSAVLG